MTRYHVYLITDYGKGHATLLGKYDRVEEIIITPSVFAGEDLVITIERVDE